MEGGVVRSGQCWGGVVEGLMNSVYCEGSGGVMGWLRANASTLNGVCCKLRSR